MRIRTVLCPTDFSTLEPAEVDVALEVCRTFGARLVLHHNLSSPEEGRAQARRHLHRVIERVAAEVAAEGVITFGPVRSVVLGLAREVQADLVVLGSHGWSTREHASVTEQLIAAAPFPVLAFQERADMPRFCLRADGDASPRAVVLTDLTHASLAAVGYAFALARTLPLRLELLHVVDPGHAGRERLQCAHAALDALVPPDLGDRISTHVRAGPAVALIVEYLEERQPVFCVLGEHVRGLLRRLLTRDTTRAVLHRVDCPLWVVPPGQRPA
jgi:nucleotide-binding universal stress UspA family protein